MKKVIAILTNDEKFNITDLLMKETNNSVFLGSWGKFSNDNAECINAVSTAVNMFLENEDKQLIVFACHKDNVNNIKEKIIECDFNVLHSNNI